MITEKQKQIIRLLLTSKEGYNVNQIARLLNISVSWTHETLKLLEKENILISVKLGNAIFFRINWQNQKAQKITELILLDEKQPKIPEKTESQVSNVQPKYQNIQSFYTKAINQRGYAQTQQSSANIDGPYRQAVAAQSSVNYNAVNPVGNQGVNNVLFSYASTGAFGSDTGYSASKQYNVTQVPPSTLGSKVSSNVSGFSLPQHTSSHKSVVQGCRYCG